MNKKVIFDGCLLSFWGFIGVGTGIGFAFYAHPALGNLDIMSLAGVALTVLFALIAGSTFKNHYDSLEKLHKESQKDLEQKWLDEFKAKSEALNNQYKQMEDSYGKFNVTIAANNNANLHYIQELEGRIKELEEAKVNPKKK